MKGYDYQLPALGYTPDATWGAWDLVGPASSIPVNLLI